jgi:hypothetical protein
MNEAKHGNLIGLSVSRSASPRLQEQASVIFMDIEQWDYQDKNKDELRDEMDAVITLHEMGVYHLD